MGIATFIVGIATLVEAAGTITGNPAMAESGFNIFLISGAAWPVWFGISLLVRINKAKRITSGREKMLDELYQVG